MEKHLIVWKEAKITLEKVISEINSDICVDNSDIEKLQIQVDEIREGLRHMDSEDRKYELDTLSGKRKRIDDKQRVVNGIHQFAKSPYFARIDCKDTFFISKDKSDPDKNIYSFTSPIAKLRFKDIGESVSIGDNQYKVIQKNTYKIDNGKVLWLEHTDNGGTFDYDGKDVIFIDRKQIDIPVNKMQHQEEIVKYLHTERPVVQQEINRIPAVKKVNGLASIAELMKEEQDKVMRSPANGVTLITGSAGSGKTNIAIHKIKYLVNEFPNEFRRDNIGIFCYNIALKNYLMNLINELELNSSNVFSYDEWIRDILIRKTNVRFINYANEDDDIKYLKTRKDIAKIIEHFMEHKKRNIINAIIEDYCLGECKNIIKNIKSQFFTVSDLINIRNAISNTIISKNKILKDRSKNVVNRIMFKLQLNNIKKEKNTAENSDSINIIDERLRKIIIAEYCEEWNWNDNNIKFDAIKLLNQLYSYDEFVKYIGNRRDYGKLINNSINSSDAYVLGYLLSLIHKNIFNEKYNCFDHLVVDEVQDFTPVQIQLLFNISNKSLTLAGDVTQKIFSNGVVSWDEIGVEISSRYELNMTHRASLETVLFANSILKETSKSTVAKSVGKRGLKPVVMRCNKGESIIQAINQINKIKKENPYASIAVVYPTKTMLNSVHNQIKKSGIDSYIALRDKWEFKSRVAISTYYQIKGLEFDYIIVLGLNFYENSYLKNKENVLYTVVTRAKNRIFINYEVDIPKLIKKIDTDLYEPV